MIHALHGNLGSPEDWDALGLDGLRMVDLWDWQARVPGISLEEFGSAFADEVASIDAEPVLLGYSLGGRLALHALAARPELWKAVILVSTHPGLESDEERRQRLTADREWARRAREEEWAVFLDAWNAQPVLQGQPESPAQAALESRREEISGAFESWSLGCQRLRDFGGAVPLLAVTGERDAKFSALAGRWAKAHHEVIADCGHRVVQEQPGRLGEVVRSVGQIFNLPFSE